ncbi:hypothetical protein JCM18897A_13350 [Streptomyces sp. JCM 18897]
MRCRGWTFVRGLPRAPKLIPVPPYKHFEEPKPGYVADWAELPKWQQETDADIFEVIERYFPPS